MKKNLILITIFLIISLSGCLNPFYDYAHDYTNVVWESTESSDIDVTIYVIEGNTFNNVAVFNHNNEKYYFNAFIDTTVFFEIIDENGFCNDYISYISGNGWQLDDGIFTAEIDNDSIFNHYEEKTIQLTKRDFYKDEIKFYMYINAEINSNDNTLNTFSYINHEEQNFMIGFITHGTFIVNNVTYDIKLKLTPDNTFEIYDLDTNVLLFKGYIENDFKTGKFVFDDNNQGITELDVTLDFM